jgi:hypothetical protein
MNNFLVETKYEYTTQLINILTPLVYEGLQSIYLEARKISTNEDIFRNFQIFLKRIPKWDNQIVSIETTRILNNSKSYSWLNDLIKATLKANIIVLIYNPLSDSSVKVNPDLYNNIKIEDFIHKIYIECARELWNNPYLLYHEYPPIELKRNQRDTINVIKECIKEAIRKLLPVQHILHIYLGEDMEKEGPNDNFENSISEIEEKNLSKLIKKDLYDDYFIPSRGVSPVSHVSPKNKSSDTSNIKISNNSQNVGSKILEIINNKDLKLTDDNTSSDNNNYNYKPNDTTEQMPKYKDQELRDREARDTRDTRDAKDAKDTRDTRDTRDARDARDRESRDARDRESRDRESRDRESRDRESRDRETRDRETRDRESRDRESIDSRDSRDSKKSFNSKYEIKQDSINRKINNVLDNDLGDSETSISFRNNEKFHEVFSNSIIEEDLYKKPHNLQNKDKAKFFSNYLNV